MISVYIVLKQVHRKIDFIRFNELLNVNSSQDEWVIDGRFVLIFIQKEFICEDKGQLIRMKLSVLIELITKINQFELYVRLCVELWLKTKTKLQK